MNIGISLLSMIIYNRLINITVDKGFLALFDIVSPALQHLEQCLGHTHIVVGQESLLLTLGWDKEPEALKCEVV